MRALFFFLILILFSFVNRPAMEEEKTSDIHFNILNQPIELGKVNWGRDLEKGIQLSKQMNKPIFLLFQEVPGCTTCQNYGQSVLSHPLVVEAIQSEFIPVAIFNNKGGKDAAVLKEFREPSWNNPVVRVVDANKNDLVSRVAGNYSKLGVVNAMIDGLTQSQIEIPEYLSLLKREFEGRANGLKEATVSMYCFWTGEKQLSALPGVIETQPGFMGGKEVVQVMYDPQETTYESVIQQAHQKANVEYVFSTNKNEIEKAKEIIGNKVSKKENFRIDVDPKYYLSKTDYQYIPMTTLQQSLVNAQIGNRSNPEFLLSPWQRNYLKSNSSRKRSMINVDISEGWNWN